jgi:hypothetical protein
MHIYDEQGQERDREWLNAMFGPQVRVDASRESPAFRVVQVRASTSNTATVTVLDETGKPMPEVDVVYAHTSGSQVVREKTDQNGQIQIPLDRDYRYGVPAQAGPCHAGIPRRSTDVIYGLGEVIVHGGDNRHLEITFQWLEDLPVTPPETPPSPSPVDEPWQQLFAKLDRIIALLERYED